MNIINNNDLVKKIATLSNLEFNEEEVEKMSSQFEKILYYISKIEEIDLSDVEPISQISNNTNVFREDIAVTSVSTQEALSNSPTKNDYFFKVPKVIE